MIAATRMRRVAVWVWVLLAVIVWNALYDMRITLGVRDYLLHQALHQAGQGPAVTISDAMAATVRAAIRVATLWGSVILAAGLWTVWTLSRAPRLPPQGGNRTT